MRETSYSTFRFFCVFVFGFYAACRRHTWTSFRSASAADKWDTAGFVSISLRRSTQDSATSVRRMARLTPSSNTRALGARVSGALFNSGDDDDESVEVRERQTDTRAGNALSFRLKARAREILCVPVCRASSSSSPRWSRFRPSSAVFFLLLLYLF